MLGFIAGYLYGRHKKHSRKSVVVVLEALAYETEVPLEALMRDKNLYRMLEVGGVSYEDCLNYIYDVWA